MPWRPPSEPEAWADLGDEEYRTVWDQVYDRFDFHPTTNPEEWPSFREPAHSMTWETDSVFAVDFPQAEFDAAAQLRAAFETLVPEDRFVYALDWQHPGYRFRPARARPPTTLESWLVPVIPDGDYYLFLAEDFRFGWLSHPWEQTICIFGELLEVMKPYFDRQPWPVKRTGQGLGHP